MKKINPFEVERLRQSLAGKKDYISLKKHYSKSLPEIEDINDTKFWDTYYQDNILIPDPMTRERVKLAVKYMPKGKLKVLDIGAGSGILESMIHGDSLELYGTDISNVSVERLKEKFQGKFLEASIYELKFPDNYFDVIFVLEVLEHIPPSKVLGVLENINRILKKDGNLIVSVPMNEGLEKMETNPSGHLRTYNEDLIKAELELCGFKILNEQTLYAFSKLHLVKTLIARLLKKEGNNIILKAVKK